MPDARGGFLIAGQFRIDARPRGGNYPLLRFDGRGRLDPAFAHRESSLFEGRRVILGAQGDVWLILEGGAKPNLWHWNPDGSWEGEYQSSGSEGFAEEANAIELRPDGSFRWKP
jgi:hypothetical protein